MLNLSKNVRVLIFYKCVLLRIRIRTNTLSHAEDALYFAFTMDRVFIFTGFTLIVEPVK
jgi:hypothetical protein